MFEVGFSEIVVIFVVALIVIGPERLPKTARTLGILWGRTRKKIAAMKAEIESEMSMEDIRKLQELPRQLETEISEQAKETAKLFDDANPDDGKK